MRAILVGYDGTRPAERALWRAAELAKAFDSKVVVVSVATPQPLAAPGAFGLMPYYAYQAEELGQTPRADEALWQQHRERVQAFFAGAGVAVHFAGVLGQPVEEIVELERRLTVQDGVHLVQVPRLVNVAKRSGSRRTLRIDAA